MFLCSTYDVADLPPGEVGSRASGYLNRERFGVATLRRLWAGRVPGSFATC